ncbi:MAG: hypothetical protein ACLT33_05700 [Lachnospira pectinoschiza]
MINHFVKKDGAFVQIKVDGQVVNTIPVNQNETLTISKDIRVEAILSQ